MRKLLPLAFAIASAASQAAAADDWSAQLRYRHEAVDDEAFAREAAADTLRLRLGYLRSFPRGLSVFAEGEAVAELGDRFNSGANGETAFPGVPDARALEVNQAWLRWQGDHLAATIGRQRLVLDNQRFLGASSWRQNEQSFDALWLEARPSAAWTLRYGWLGRVHRAAGDDAIDPLARERRLDTHLLNAAWAGPAGTVVGYGYWHADRDLATASTRTLGLRWTGTRAIGAVILGGSLEAARQRDHADNPLRVDAGYWLVEPSLAAHGLSWKLGWEHLGGDGSTAFQTPLATLHAVNGWADKFTTTPANGLEDRYASVAGTLGRGRLQGKLAWLVAWHDFDADRGGADYGREWNASLSFPVVANVTGLLKFADYRSDGFARDTRKLWLQLEWILPSRP